ncbi:MAG: hypothetical protein LBD29_11015 [Treponema sp.]|nr:hypothetical protein [Treponema sp.]
MKINALLNPLQRLVFVVSLGAASFPLFAGSAQEAELDALLKLKKPGSAQSRMVTEENGITQEIDGEYLVVTKGDMTIRMPLAFGLEKLQEIIDMLNNGLNPSAINGKWEVVAEDPENTENNRYVSFEFDEGNFIVVESNAQPTVQTDPVVHFGAYKIQNQMIALGDFGYMQNIVLDLANEMEFSFGSEEDSEIPIKVRKVPNVAESEQTNLLCRTWKLVRRGGVETFDTQYEDTILFTKAGTYLVTYPNQELGIAQWRWVDIGETQFEYSWDNWQEPGLVQIYELEAASFKVEDKAAISYEFVPAN